MDILYFVTTLLFTLSVLRNSLFWLKILRNNDHKLNFFLVKQKIQKKPNSYYLLLILKTLGLLLYVFIIINDNLLFIYHLVIFCIFLIDDLIFIREIRRDEKIYQVFNLQSLIYFVPTLILIYILYLNPLLDPYFWLLLLERFVLFYLIFIVLAFTFPLEIFEDIQIYLIKKQKSKLQKTRLIIFKNENAEKSSSVAGIFLSKRYKTVRYPHAISGLTGMFMALNSFKKKNCDIGIIYLKSDKNYKKTRSEQFIKPAIIVNDSNVILYKGKKLTGTFNYPQINICGSYVNTMQIISIAEYFELSKKEITEIIYKLNQDLFYSYNLTEA